MEPVVVVERQTDDPLTPDSTSVDAERRVGRVLIGAQPQTGRRQVVLSVTTAVSSVVHQHVEDSRPGGQHSTAATHRSNPTAAAAAATQFDQRR